MQMKLKTRSAAKKRFSKTGNGKKIKRAHAFRRKLLSKKTTKRKRDLRKRAYVSSVDMRHIANLLPY